MDFCCSICMESFGNSCEIATIPCGHVFHEACIKKWHSAQKQCSQCRKKCKSEEILRLFISETENGLKDNKLRIKYEERILNLKKEICNLKADKLTCCVTTLGEESKIKLENLNLKTANLALKAKNVKLEDEDLNLKTASLALKAKNLKLEEKNLIFEKKNVELQSRQKIFCESEVELQRENIKLSKKLENLKFHERNTQKMLRDNIDEINSKRNDIKYDLDMQIAETKKAKREIMALEAKYATWVPSYQMPRRNYKRKPETTRQHESKLATNQSPPQKKKKQTLQKLPAVESNTEVIESLEDVHISPTVPTPTSPVHTPTSPVNTPTTSISYLLPNRSISREISEFANSETVQLMDSLFPSRSCSNASSRISPHSNSRSRTRSHSSASSFSNSHSRSRSRSSASSRSGSESGALSQSSSDNSASSQSGSESSASHSRTPSHSRSRSRSRSSSRSSTHTTRSRSRSRSTSVFSGSRSSSPIYTVYQNITHTYSFAVNQDNHQNFDP